MKPLVIYHDNCADGFGAAFAAWLKFYETAEYRPAQYNVEVFGDGETVAGRDVYILDFSFDKQTMHWIFDNANRVIWLDHHATAFEMWCNEIPDGGLFYDKEGNNLVVLDNDKSGAMIAWEYFHPEKEVPVLIKHIDDRDRWQFKIEGTKEFSAALFSYMPWSFEQWLDMFKYFDEEFCSDYSCFMSEGEAILRAQRQQVQKTAEQAKECSIVHHFLERLDEYCYPNEREFEGLAVNCPPFLASDVGHELATQCGTFGLCWYMDAQNVVKCSLRSNGDYDVSDIAKSFGGGGHKNAAGFSLSIEQLMGWLK